MEAKKTSKANLENKKGLFVQIGIVAALLLSLAAFNWKTYERSDFEQQVRKGGAELEEIIIPPTEELLPPEPQRVEVQVSTTEVQIRENNEIEGTELTGGDIGNNDEGVNTEGLPYLPPTIEDPEEIDDTPLIIVEDMPEFVGGYGELQKFLSQNLNYPRLARETGIQGKVFVTFVVEKDGSVTNARVLRDIGGGCGAEALRVVKSMPRWEAGKQRGKPVRVEMNLPVMFVLQ